MKRKLTIVLFIFLSYFSYAQQLEVLDFHSDPTMIDAVRFSKNDFNGERCGLIKLGLVMPEAIFEGNVVYKEYKSGEWWIYLTKGSRWLTIKSKEYLPLQYEFPEPIQSNVTYVMIVEKKNNNEEWSPTKAKKQYDISFYEKSEFMDSRLFAKIDGIEYYVDIPDESYDPNDPNYIYTKCFMVAEQEDFDGNGIVDALIEETIGCGNLGLMAYYVVSYSEDGYFSISNSVFGNKYAIEDWKGRKSIAIIDASVGFDSDKMDTKKERYIFKDGKLEFVETMKKQPVITIKELKSSDFNREDGKPLKLEYDLDENGITDYFECYYWSRWGSMMIDYFVLNGKKVTDDYWGSAFRIGVLSSKTNGYHDLVFDENTIIKWDGKKYVFPKR